MLDQGKYQCTADLFILFGFSCFAYVELASALVIWSNPNQFSRMSYVQSYLPLWFSEKTSKLNGQQYFIIMTVPDRPSKLPTAAAQYDVFDQRQTLKPRSHSRVWFQHWLSRRHSPSQATLPRSLRQFRSWWPRHYRSLRPKPFVSNSFLRCMVGTFRALQFTSRSDIKMKH